MSFEKLWKRYNQFFIFLTPAADLLIRFIIAKIFFISGLLKIETWSSTLMLFHSEYSVPFLPPALAATLAAFIEIFFSLLLFLGLFDRIPALILFIFNIVTVISYPYLWTDAGYVGLKDHFYWGLLLLFLTMHGPGKISLDQLWLSKNKKLIVKNPSNSR